MRVGWKVTTLALNVASVRYRAVLPMLALSREGVVSTVFRSAGEHQLDGLDVVVFVKSFSSDDLGLAQRAAARGIGIVIDLCDNIFVPGYGGPGGGPAQVFLAIAKIAQAIVVTTTPLAQEVLQRLPGANVAVVPDGIETPEVAAFGEPLFRQALAAERTHPRDAVLRGWTTLRRRVQAEGAGVLSSIAVYYARRAATAVRVRIRKASSTQLAHRLAAAAARNSRRLADRVFQLRSAPVSSAARAPVPAGAPAAAALTPKRLLWFGNHGAPYARFGMLDLLEMRAALEGIARETDVELVVISDNRAKYEQAIRPLAIPSRYVPWSPSAVQRWMDLADVVLVPNTLDPFSICKSANRTVLALMQGVPVVATPTPGLAAVLPYIAAGDPLEGLRRYLGDPAAGRADVAAGRAAAQEAFGDAAIAGAWNEVLRRAVARKDQVRAATPALLLLLHLAQDLDPALPVLLAAQAAGIEVEAWCSAGLIGRSPRVLRLLQECEVPFRVVMDPAGDPVPFPASARVLLTVAESTLHAHRFAHALSRQARAAGLFVATLQHGFDNVGLTYEDAVQPLDHVDFAAERIYTWGGSETLHPRLSEAVRSRCRPVGKPWPQEGEADLSARIPPEATVVGVFENLHWHRYDEAYRRAFIASVRDAARAAPGVVFLVKPHHAGAWWSSEKPVEGPEPANVVVADPRDSYWERFTAGALLGRISAAITTPSTVALEAAFRRVPVAVVAGDLALPRYAPLRLLRTAAEWSRFLDEAMDAPAREQLVQAGDAFIARSVLPGDGARAIVEDLRPRLLSEGDRVRKAVDDRRAA